MAERQKMNTGHTKKAHVYRSKSQESAANSIKEFLSELDRESHFLALMELAAQAMAAVALIVEEELEIEWVFEKCEEATLSSLKDRANQWLSKLAALEAQNKAAH